MPTHHGSKALRDLKKFLKTCECEWEIKPGTKHNKIYINGRMVGVISNKDSDTDAVNHIQTIRKILGK